MKKQSDDFRMILDSYLTETADDLEEYRVLLPKTDLFWDNGYEDVKLNFLPGISTDYAKIHSLYGKPE